MYLAAILARQKLPSKVEEKKSPRKKYQKPINMEDIVAETIEILLETAVDGRKLSDITANDIEICLVYYMTTKKQIKNNYRKKKIRLEIISKI